MRLANCGPQHPVGRHPAASSDRHLSGSVCALIDAVGAPQFGVALLDSVNHVVGIRYFAAYRMSGTATRFLFGAVQDNLAALQPSTRRYVDRYACADTPRSMALESARAPAEVLTACVAVHELPDEGHRQLLERLNVLERIALYFPDGSAGWIGLHMMRDRGQGPVSDREFARLESLAPVFAGFVTRHLAFIGGIDEPASNVDLRRRLLKLEPGLSPRELAVCMGMLAGRSMADLAVSLGIGVASVRTYRKRAYEKLGVGEMRELFMALLGGGHPRDI